MRERLKVFIHGGMHKTGTTSVQAALASAREDLAAAGIWYPRGGAKEAARAINAKRADWEESRVLEALEAARRSGASQVVFSLESVSTFSDKEFKRLTAAFAGCELTYLFVFRHWSGYLPSRWMQYVLRRDSQTFGRYVARTLAGDHVDHRFDLVLDRTLDSGRCSVEAISYDWEVANRGSILPAVFRALRLDRAVRNDLLSDARWLQPAPDREGREVIRLLNGVLADRMALPQDDNFHAVGQGRLCDVFFDLHGAEFPQPVRAGIMHRGRATVSDLCLAADRPEAGALVERHRRLFLDLGSRPVFPEYRRRGLPFWTLEWPDVADVPGVAELVERMVPLVAERIAGRQALTSRPVRET